MGQSRFYLLLILGGMVHLAIGGAKFIGGEVAVGLSGWFLWRVLTNFRRYCTSDVGS